MNHMQKVFSDWYMRGGWKGQNGESFSGLGSDMAYTEHFRENLLDIIEKHQIKSIFDCSCGDWNWMKEIKDKLPKYVGNDIVEALITLNNKKFSRENITFVCGDALSMLNKYQDKEFDLIICRHTLEHLPQTYNLNLINEIKRTGRSAIITSANNHCSNRDVSFESVPPSREIDLDISPYVEMLGIPYEIFPDQIGIPSDKGCFGYYFKF